MDAVAILWVALAICLAWAAISDFRRYEIPDYICIAVAAGFVIYAFVGPLDLKMILVALGIALAAFAVGVLLFARGWLGGGDVKLLAALALWVGSNHLLHFALVMGMAGGVLATVYALVGWAKATRNGSPSDAATIMSVKVPYGIAIAAAGIDLSLTKLNLL